MTGAWHESDISGPARTTLPIPLPAGSVVYVEADVLDQSLGSDGEHEVAGSRPDLSGVLRGLQEFAEQLSRVSPTFGADKVSVQFGCELGLEAGGLVALIGKASAKSSMTVTLEWSKQED